MADEPLLRERVQVLLYEAGCTLLALRVPGCWPATYRSGMPEYLRDPEDVANETHDDVVARPARPSGAAIDKMDEVYGWVRRLPARTPVELRLKRLVHEGMRQVNVHTREPKPNWSKLGRKFDLSHHWAKKLWGDGLDAVTAIANRPAPCAATWARIQAHCTANRMDPAPVAEAPQTGLQILRTTAHRPIPAVCRETIRRVIETTTQPASAGRERELALA